MSRKSARMSIIAAFTLTALAPMAASAAQMGTAAQQKQNITQAENLRARMDVADTRIDHARQSRKIQAAKATALHRQIMRDRKSMKQLSAKQGFVSAAEFASYQRTLDAIDMKLDRLGVPQSYGNDMLPAVRKHR